MAWHARCVRFAPLALRVGYLCRGGRVWSQLVCPLPDTPNWPPTWSSVRPSVKGPEQGRCVTRAGRLRAGSCSRGNTSAQGAVQPMAATGERPLSIRSYRRRRHRRYQPSALCRRGVVRRRRLCRGTLASRADDEKREQRLVGARPPPPPPSAVLLFLQQCPLLHAPLPETRRRGASSATPPTLHTHTDGGGRWGDRDAQHRREVGGGRWLPWGPRGRGRRRCRRRPRRGLGRRRAAPATERILPEAPPPPPPPHPRPSRRPPRVESYRGESQGRQPLPATATATADTASTVRHSHRHRHRRHSHARTRPRPSRLVSAASAASF